MLKTCLQLSRTCSLENLDSMASGINMDCNNMVPVPVPVVAQSRISTRSFGRVADLPNVQQRILEYDPIVKGDGTRNNHLE